MPCRRAPLELTADATLETISRSRSEPVRDASDHAACLCADGPQPRHQKVGRCVDKALQPGALAALQDLPGRPAQIPRASLGCRAGLSKAERPGFVDDEIAVAARSIAKSACRS